MSLLRNSIRFVFLTCLFMNSITFSQQRAVTEDGKTVILYSDGTWKYDTSTPYEADSNAFRDTYWGMTKTQVKAVEKSELVKEDTDLLAYKGNVAELNCYILYIFVDGLLVRGKYVIIEEHSNRNDYISDYKKLKNLLQGKYKKPSKDEIYWKNDLYRDEYQSWGFAVSLGHLVYFTEWKTPTTDINLGLYGENYDITLAVEYISTKYKGLEEAAKKKKAKSKL